jgi:hypothetical protein
MPVVMLTIFPRPTDPVLNKYTVATIFTCYSSLAPEPSISLENISTIFTLLPHRFPPPLVDPTNVFVVGTVTEMVSKMKPAEEEENLFVPPPVDLDKIPLVDKDRLIADTICSFDFSDL